VTLSFSKRICSTDIYIYIRLVSYGLNGGVQSPAVAGTLLFATTSSRALGQAQSFDQWVRSWGAWSWQPPPSNAEVTNEWSFTSLSHKPSWYIALEQGQLSQVLRKKYVASVLS